jgi:hypothetical protein
MRSNQRCTRRSIVFRRLVSLHSLFNSSNSYSQNFFFFFFIVGRYINSAAARYASRVTTSQYRPSYILGGARRQSDALRTRTDLLLAHVTFLPTYQVLFLETYTSCCYCLMMLRTNKAEWAESQVPRTSDSCPIAEYGSRPSERRTFEERSAGAREVARR